MITRNDLMSISPEVYSMATEMMQAQPSNERLHYMDAVMEAINDTRGSLIQKLYMDIVRKSDTNYADIDASHGILIKYKHYDKMMGAVDAIKEVAQVLSMNVENSPAHQTFIRLHEIMVSEAKNFEMGYKFNIDFLKITYNVLVLTLNELIDVMICDLAETIKGPTVSNWKPGNGTKKYQRHSAMIVNQANAFIRSYEKGEWAAVVKTFKGNKEAFLGTALTVTGIAVVSVIAALGVIRLLIYYFWHTKTKLADYAKDQADVLKTQMEMEKGAPGEKERAKMLAFLESKAQLIKARVAKNEADATKNQTASNREDFNKDALQGSSSGSDEDFELI